MGEAQGHLDANSVGAAFAEFQLASQYRTSSRPLNPEKVERVLMQLDRAELALRREG